MEALQECNSTVLTRVCFILFMSTFRRHIDLTHYTEHRAYE